MKNKIPILLVTHDRAYLLDIVLTRIIKYTDWDKFELWILDNASTPSNRKVINAFAAKYKFINVHYQFLNQISVIQNTLISKLNRDIYIKLDDDIFVTENWTNGFINIFNRHTDISIGSAVIPINGFGWTLFLKIMGYDKNFLNVFPDVKLIQGCTEPAVWNNEKVAEYIWNQCLDLNLTSKIFHSKQNYGYQDFIVPYRYSIGAISFPHDFWQKMGGWKVDDTFKARLKVYNSLNYLNQRIAKLRKKEKQNRINDIISIVTKMNKSALGIEEEYLFIKNKELGLNQYVTSESLVHHFSFFPTEDHLIKKVLLNIKYY